MMLLLLFNLKTIFRSQGKDYMFSMFYEMGVMTLKCLLNLCSVFSAPHCSEGLRGLKE